MITNLHEPMNRAGALLAMAGGAAALATGPLAAEEMTTVSIGVVNTSSDVPFFIADRLGYFKEAGIIAKFVSFDGAPTMIAPLGGGQLDAGGGAPSAGLYNAIVSKIDVKMVADKGSVPPGYGYGPLMVRKALVQSGRYKTVRDLKGMKFAETAPGSVLSATIHRLLQSGGLTYNDVEHVYLGFPQQAAAFSTGAIDASLTAEPSATLAERSGVAVRVMGNDKWYPNQEQSVLIYGSSLLHNRRDVAQRFMNAYIRATRYFNDALVDGHIRGRTAKDVIDILVEATPIKDRTVFADMTSNAVNPNGRMNPYTLAEDLAFFKSQGLISGNVNVLDAMDPSFARNAVRTLGPYKPNK